MDAQYSMKYGQICAFKYLVGLVQCYMVYMLAWCAVCYSGCSVLSVCRLVRRAWQLFQELSSKG